MQRILWERLIIALDLKDENKIKNMVGVFKNKKVKFKIGLIAFTKFGPSLVKKLIKNNIDVFLDLKLYDIPNTMLETSKVIAELGCWAFTVHIKAGKENLKNLKEELVKFCKEKKIKVPLVLGVTELTSNCAEVEDVLKLTEIAYFSNLDGVIASAKEVKFIKEKFKNLKVITPGIRPLNYNSYDQKRITTAKEAFSLGADYIVVGRPIIEARDYFKAVRDIFS